jgi:hypothetical protein
MSCVFLSIAFSLPEDYFHGNLSEVRNNLVDGLMKKADLHLEESQL